MGLVLGLLSNLELQQLQLIQAYDVIEGTLSLPLSCNPPYPSSAYKSSLPPPCLEFRQLHLTWCQQSPSFLCPCLGTSSVHSRWSLAGAQSALVVKVMGKLNCCPLLESEQLSLGGSTHSEECLFVGIWERRRAVCTCVCMYVWWWWWWCGGSGGVRVLETIYRLGFSIKLTSPVQECSCLRQWAKWSCLKSKERSRSF